MIYIPCLLQIPELLLLSNFKNSGVTFSGGKFSLKYPNHCMFGTHPVHTKLIMRIEHIQVPQIKIVSRKYVEYCNFYQRKKSVTFGGGPCWCDTGR